MTAVDHLHQSCQTFRDRIQHIQKFEDAGYDYVAVHNTGPDHDGFFRSCEKTLEDGPVSPIAPGLG
jgi:hypothetical protein